MEIQYHGFLFAHLTDKAKVMIIADVSALGRLTGV